jgi:hypothetical protein
MTTSEFLAMRSCWECNPSHEHLKRANGKFWCFVCGRRYEDGRFGVVGEGSPETTDDYTETEDET